MIIRSEPRKLTVDDLIRMQIPIRYYPPQIKHDQLSPHVLTYLRNLAEHLKVGRGIMLYGDNGVGKTTGMIAILQHANRLGASSLLMESARLKEFVFDRTPFDDRQTMWDRIRNVGILGIDDVGKDRSDTKGYQLMLLDEMIRYRMMRRLTTLITTNLMKSAFPEFFMKSTLEAMKDCIVTYHVDGDDFRMKHTTENRQQIESGRKA